MEKTIKSGDATIGVSGSGVDDLLRLLRTVAPKAADLMDESLATIEREAKKEWPKRKLTRKFNRATGKVYFKDESENSWNQFERSVKVDAQGNIVVALKNNAPYSWAIKFGVDPKNKDRSSIMAPQGKRVAQELLIKPLRKSSKLVIKELTKALMKRY
jgi:hypothetical protein